MAEQRTGECETCHAEKPTYNLRPYGPGGSTICFQCAFATPEDEATTKASMRALMGAAAAVSPTGVIAIGTPDGPMAFNPKGAPRG